MAADLAKIRSLTSKNEGDKCWLIVTDVFTKYAWVKPLLDKKAVFNGFIGIVNESKSKPNKN